MSTPEQREFVRAALLSSMSPGSSPTRQLRVEEAVTALLADAERLERLEADLAACARLVEAAESAHGVGAFHDDAGACYHRVCQALAAIPEPTRQRLRALLPEEPA